jgi:4'-phosphopantetheinyl transferase EntD
VSALTGSDFDPIKWAKTGRYRTMEGKRAHTAMDPETGATILVVESPADAEAYEATRQALGRGIVCVEVKLRNCPICAQPLVTGRDDAGRPCWPCAQRGSR